MSPHAPATVSGAYPAKGPQPAKAPVDADIRVCLDFIKGRCTRARCRFHHPEMAQYQQVSNAVQASAGKQICEVWAMAGQCKFGSKCNKLHPVVLSPASQPALAVPLPQQPVAPTPAAVAVVPQRRCPATPPSPSPLPSPTASPLPPLPAAPLMGPQPRAAAAPARPTGAAPAVEDAEAEFEDLAQSILKVLEAEEEWEQPSQPVAGPKGLPSTLPGSTCKGGSLTSLLGMDRIFLDILSDLNLTAC